MAEQNVGSVFVQIAVSMRKFIADLGEAVGLSKKAGDDIEDALGSGPRRSIKKFGQEAKEETEKVGKYFKDVSRIISGIVISQTFYNSLNAIERAAVSLHEFHMNIEDATVAFRHLLGTQAEAESFTRALQDFAIQSPFAFEDLTLAARKLQGFGFSIKSTIPILKVLGDQAAAVGGGADVVEGLARAIGQIATNGRVMKEELNQLAERGVNAMKILREELNLSQDQMANIGKLNIPASVAIPALLRGMQKQSEGLMDSLNDTMRGMIANIGDAMKQLGNVVFAGFFDNMKERISGFRDRLEELNDAARKFGTGGIFEKIIPKELQGPVRQILTSFKSIAVSLGDIFVAIRPVLKAMGQFTAAILGVAAPIISVLAKALALLAAFVTQNERLIKALVFSILLLRLATTAAAWITILAKAIKGLTVAQAAANSVRFLGINIRRLHVLMRGNKAVTLLVLLATALAGVALSSDAASAYIEKLIGKINELMGYDPNDMFALDPQPIDEFADEWDKALEDIGFGLDGVGKDADGAGKKVEKFLASFDEVFQVPEKLDDVGAGWGDMLKDLGKIKPWKPPVEPVDKDDLFPDDVLDDSKSWWEELIDWIWLFADRIWKALKEIWKRFKIPPFDDWFPPGGPTAIVTAFENFVKGLGDVSWAPALGPIYVFGAALAAIFNPLPSLKNAWDTFWNGLGGIVLDPILTPVNALAASLNGLFDGLPDLGVQWDLFWEGLGGILLEPALSPINILAGALSGIFAGLPELGISWDTFWEGLGGVVIEPLLAPINALTGAISGMFAGLPQLGIDWDIFWDGLAGVAIDPILIPVSALTGALSGMFAGLPQMGIDWDAFWKGLVGIPVKPITDPIHSIEKAIGDLKISLPSLQVDWDKVWDGLGLTVDTQTGLITGNWSMMWRDLTNDLGIELPNLETEWNKTWNSVSDGVSDTWNNMVDDWNSYWSETNKAADTNGNVLDGIFKDVMKDIQDTLGLNKTESKKIWDETHKDGKTGWQGMLNDMEASLKAFTQVTAPKWWNENKDATMVILSLMGEGLVARVLGFIPRIGTALKGFPGEFSKVFNTVKTNAAKWIDDLMPTFSTLRTRVANVFSGIVDDIGKQFNKFLEKLDPTKWGLGDLFKVPNINIKIPGFATGGIVGKEQVVKVAEGNKREAIIPLESNAMAPFAKAVADVLDSRMPRTTQTVEVPQQNDPPVTVNAGVVIADDRSLRQFARILIPHIDAERRRT